MTTEYFMTGLFTHVDDQFNEQGINGYIGPQKSDQWIRQLLSPKLSIIQRG